MTKRALLALAALLLGAGCAGPVLRTLSYADVQALNPGVSADWVLEEYPFGEATRDAQGRVRSIRYRVNDPLGRAQTLDLAVDERGIVGAKRYSGPVVRPRSGP